MLVERHEEREIYAPLTEDEARNMMRELADSVRRATFIKQEKSDALADFKKRLEAVDKRQTELVGIVTTKTIKQKKTVRVTYDFENGVKHVWSPFKTNTIITQEPISDDERKRFIPKLEAAPEGAADAPATIDAAILTQIESVQCGRCHRFVAIATANENQDRDAKSGELLRTVYLCRDVADCMQAAGTAEADEPIPAESDEPAAE